MISNLNSKINEFLNSEKIPKENFDDLKNVPENMEFSLLTAPFKVVLILLFQLIFDLDCFVLMFLEHLTLNLPSIFLL